MNGWARLLLAAFLLIAAPPAWAGSAYLNAEFTLYPGGTFYHWWTSCIWGPDVPFDQGDGTHGMQCVSVPGTIIGFSGTSTLKGDVFETLVTVFCDGQVLWAGEQKCCTVPIMMTGLEAAGLTGPCYVGLQSVAPRVLGAGYEIQMIIYYKTP